LSDISLRTYSYHPHRGIARFFVRQLSKISSIQYRSFLVDKSGTGGII
jgi:hypothetical protein